MRRIFINVMVICLSVLLTFSLIACSNKADRVSNRSNYEITGGEIADYLNYNFQNRSMYIAGLKSFKEFGASNEGTVSIDTDNNTLAFTITKATGSVTGAVDGPEVYFIMDLAKNKITDKRFEPASNYRELDRQEFIEHSEEVIQLTDERMVEMGEFFEELITKIESN